MSMNTELSPLLGIGYVLGLIVFAVATSMLKLWRRYIFGILIFVVAFNVGTSWIMEGTDGPSGFGLAFVHGLIVFAFLLSNAIKWIWIAISNIQLAIATGKDRSP